MAKAKIRKRGIIGKPGGEPLILADGRPWEDAMKLKRYIAEYGHPPPDMEAPRDAEFAREEE